MDNKEMTAEDNDNFLLTGHSIQCLCGHSIESHETRHKIAETLTTDTDIELIEYYYCRECAAASRKGQPLPPTIDLAHEFTPDSFKPFSLMYDEDDEYW
jgi:acetone carboxylase gamma subunit